MPDATQGRKTMLSRDIELQLVEMLLLCARNAVAVNVSQLSSIVISYLNKMGVDTSKIRCCEAWCRAFLMRHPVLAKRLPSKTNQARLVHWNRISFAEWRAIFAVAG